MTPEERDRLVRLEAKHEQLEEWMASISKKLDEVRLVAHMGKGALWIMLKLGAVALALAGAGAWAFEKFHR